MLEPPSHELVRQLTELQLCYPSDFRRARSRVRRLAFDLPAFDSVWIDSLVQLRLLTRYQAKQFEEGHADRLRIGSFVVIDELGCSSRGSTLLARRLHQRDRCVVKRQRVAADQVEEFTRQMQFVVDRANGFAHPQLVLPNEILPSTENELVTVSRLVPGLPLNELLVRRGRFPASVVFEVGRQLLEGLAALHARSLLHGDIRMSNVRLTDTGLAVLVDGGTRQVIHPEITIHDTLALEAYDGLAPELIGTGAAPSASSELYAVGCLLWQLLAGRPPFATADPLAKIAAHQTQTIDDVRVLAPDTPEILADMIRLMTSRDPLQRPRSCDEILQRWGRPRSFSRSRLKQFRRLFNGAVPHFARPNVQNGFGNWIGVAAMLLAIVSGVTLLYDRGLRNDLLQIVQNVRSNVSHDPAVDASSALTIESEKASPITAERPKGLLRLPQPSADGTIFLSERGPYQARVVAFAGHLTIRGAIGVRPEIHINDDPLAIDAQAVSLEQITIRHVRDNGQDFLVKVRCQQLSVANCEFSALAPNVELRIDASRRPKETAALAWTSIGGDPKSALIEINNTVFHGAGGAILLAKPPGQLHVSNTLKTGRGVFVSLGPKCLATDFQLKLAHVTLRESGPLLLLSGEFANKPGVPPLLIEANDCVFVPAEPRSGFIVADAERCRPDIAKSIKLNASDSVIAPGTLLLMKIDGARNPFHVENADDEFEGLTASEIKFSGEQLLRTPDAKTVGIKGPRVVADIGFPGVDIRQLGPAN